MENSLILSPNPILLTPSKKVKYFDGELKKLVEHMHQTIKTNNGIGLAACQIGELKQVIIAQFIPEPQENIPAIPFIAMVNPKITWHSKELIEMEEGCLSFPILELPVVRSESIHVTYNDLEGNSKKIKTGGLLARIIQHEVDHIKGIVFTSRITKTGVKKLNKLKPSILFLGSSPTSVGVLEGLIENKYSIKGVITSEDKASGRGQEIKESPVSYCAKKNNIPSIKTDNLTGLDVSKFNADIGVVVDFGQIIPEKNMQATERWDD